MSDVADNIGRPVSAFKLNPHSIRRIAVNGLFGQFDYDLPGVSTEEVDLSRLMLLYGENRSGKTPLLKMVYHLLSPEDGKGHRTYLARTRFNSLIVEFANSVTIRAVRQMGGRTGILSLSIEKESHVVDTIDLPITHECKVPPSSELPNGDHWKQFLEQIRSLRIRLYYLSDDRKHQGNIDDTSDSEETDESRFHATYQMHSGVLTEVAKQENDSLLLVLSRVTAWAERQVRRGSRKGLGDSDSVYARVIHDIAHSKDAKLDSLHAEFDALATALKQHERRSAEYSKYGLTTPLNVEPFIQSMSQSDQAAMQVLYTVMRPYVDGINVRLAPLKSVYDAIHSLLQSVNTFYRNKTVHFNVDKGFTFKSGEERLDPRFLSSGERQLLLLFCNTILARGQASLLIIDEPELSLNVKWQRQLIQALLSSTADSNVQFIFATHSIELISQHRSSLVRLSNKATRSKSKGIASRAADGNS